MLWKLVKEKVSTEVFVHPCTRHLPMYFLNDKWTLAMYLAVGDRATMCRYEEAIQRSSGNDALCEAYGYTDNNFQCV